MRTRLPKKITFPLVAFAPTVYNDGVPLFGFLGDWATPGGSAAGHFFSPPWFGTLVAKEMPRQGRQPPTRLPGRLDREWFMDGGWETGASPARVLRVLVVDDNQDAADSLGALLRVWGYDFRVAYDGHSGFTTAQEYRPHCLLLDIAMPGLDGYALAQRLRQSPGLDGAKLVALTAFSDEAHARRAQDAGFDYHLVKPADPLEVERLLHMLNEVYRLASHTQDLAKQNVALASETRELLQEVKQDIREVKEEVKELKEELREVKENKD